MNDRIICKDCIYYYSITRDMKGCNYCCVTGKLRNCPVEQCNKKVVVKCET